MRSQIFFMQKNVASGPKRFSCDTRRGARGLPSGTLLRITDRGVLRHLLLEMIAIAKWYFEEKMI